MLIKPKPFLPHHAMNLKTTARLRFDCISAEGCKSKGIIQRQSHVWRRDQNASSISRSSSEMPRLEDFLANSGSSTKAAWRSGARSFTNCMHWLNSWMCSDAFAPGTFMSARVSTYTSVSLRPLLWAWRWLNSCYTKQTWKTLNPKSRLNNLRSTHPHLDPLNFIKIHYESLAHCWYLSESNASAEFKTNISSKSRSNKTSVLVDLLLCQLNLCHNLAMQELIHVPRSSNRPLFYSTLKK